LVCFTRYLKEKKILRVFFEGQRLEVAANIYGDRDAFVFSQAKKRISFHDLKKSVLK
jgi:hypothetical protein